MPTVQVKASFSGNAFGFYQPPTKDSSGVRIRDGHEFSLYYDDDHPLEDVKKDGKLVKKGVLASYMKLLEKPKKETKKTVKVMPDGDKHLLGS